MQITPLAIPDVLVFDLQLHGDQRGFFMETFREEWFAGILKGKRFVQDNHSKSVKGTLRGLHYQIRHPQGKFIRAVQGEIYDVVVDLRKHSPDFGNWLGVYLNADNNRALWVPEGFAHGFCVTSDSAEIIYKCTDYYDPEHERALLWSDPEIGIEWPISVEELVISDKDAGAKSLRDCDVYTE